MSNRSTGRLVPTSINRDKPLVVDQTEKKTGLFAKEEKPYSVGVELDMVIARANAAVDQKRNAA